MFLKSVASATITLYKVDDLALYQSEILSSNGTIFHPYDLDTTLTFYVYKGLEDITSQIEEIEWVRYSFDTELYFEDKIWGEPYKNQTSILLNKSEIISKCIIQANAYVTINDKLECVASSRITLIDVNELYSANEPPENPVDDQLWVDTSKQIPVIYSWKSLLQKWILVGQTTPFVRNLIHNSNLWRLNSTDYEEENSDYLNDIIVIENFQKNWLRLKSFKATDNYMMTAGVYQNTSYPIQKESEYVFSFLAYCLKDMNISYIGSEIYIKITSYDSDNTATTLLQSSVDLSGDEYRTVTCKFTTLSDTEKIQVFLGVEPCFLCEFYVTELCLYNTSDYYPWELSPEDQQAILDSKVNNDHMSIFNALTKNGTMGGIYIDTDETGSEHYYFNASHMKAGSIDGGLINGLGINIKDKEGQSIFHVYEDEEGETHIDLIANNLYIGQQEVSTTNQLMESISTSESNTYKKMAEDISTSQQNMIGEMEIRIEDVEENTKKYIDDSISSVKDNTDDLIQGSIDSSNSYTDEIIGQLIDSELKNLQETVASNFTSSKKYTDDEIAALLEIHNNDLSSQRTDLVKIISDTSKEIDSDISTAVSNMTNYTDNVSKALIEQINGKAEASTVNTLNTKVTNLTEAVDKNTQLITTKADKSIVDSVVEDMTELNKDLDTKVDTTTIIKSINDSTEEMKITEDKLNLTSLLEIISGLENRIKILEDELSNLKGGD